MFKRKIEEKLKANFRNPDSKILLINGARQIGKSFIIRETAKKEFKNYIEIDLQRDFLGPKLFQNVRTVQDFFLQVSATYGTIGSVEDTLVFLDEIQTYPHLLSLLKPLRETRRCRLIGSGSLLGITMKSIFIPMGSVEEVRMFPMDFEEFLWARSVGMDVLSYLKECFDKHESISDGIHTAILRRFREYLLTGGLPDSVRAFLDDDIPSMRKNQELTLAYYKADASQYDSDHSLRIRRIYDSMTSYMENKVHRVRLSDIEGKKQARIERYAEEFDYLIHSGCALEVDAITDPVFPLENSARKSLVKLYYNDVGILTNLLFRENIQSILNFDSALNLGSVYETAVAMELISHGHRLFYYDRKKVGEVDFLINDYDHLSVLPIEVKSGRQGYDFRALPRLVDPKEPYRLPQGYLLDNRGEIRTEGNILSLPVYMAMFL